MTRRTTNRSALSRRQLLAGTGTVLGTMALTACGGSNDTDTAPNGDTGGGLAGGGDANLVDLSEVPVGGAVPATDKDGKPVIVAQPTKGSVVAFSAVCTHKGCTVAPDGDLLRCPCHGSTYDLATGDNTGGPAPRPLAEIAVKVSGGVVTQS